LGLVALGVHCFIILAYRFSASMLIGALDYLRIVWALAFGFLIFNEKPMVSELIGITMICASGLISVTQMRNPKTGGDKF
jgi:drug/metabolite transporter (DMT)-like permease